MGHQRINEPKRVKAGGRLKKWRVVGKVAGPLLPTSLRRIGKFSLGPLPKEVRGLAHGPVVTPTPTSDTYYVARGGDIHVASSCFFWIDVHANSKDSAIDHVDTHEKPKLQVALSLRTDTIPYRVKVLWVTDRRTNYTYGPLVRVAFWDPRDLTAVQGVGNDLTAIEEDSTARSAARMLGAAIDQELIAVDCESEAASLLTYFKVIEIIANKVAPSDTPGRKSEEESIVSKLETQLQRKNTVAKKIAALRYAEQELSRIAGRYLSIRIERAGDVLGLSAQWKESARRFARLRNTKLGHGGANDKPLKYDLGGPPYELARDMLRGYIDHLSSSVNG